MADNRIISIPADIAMHKLYIAGAKALFGPSAGRRLRSVQRSQHGPPRRHISGLPIGSFGRNVPLDEAKVDAGRTPCTAFGLGRREKQGGDALSPIRRQDIGSVDHCHLKTYPPTVREKFNALAEELCISSMTLGELHYGAEKSARRIENLTAIEHFVARLEVLPT